ncbi:MAG: hypothetical protein VYE73_13385 [Acidobacteriota bacterium]|nr:hypothetical protein [Acidobacteriota bacterium]
MKRVLVALCLGLVVVLALPGTASACQACFGDPNDAATKGMNNAILFLLGVVGLVQVGFVSLFWQFRKRAKYREDRKKSLQVLRGGIH